MFFKKNFMDSTLKIKLDNVRDLLQKSENLQNSEYEDFLRQLDFEKNLLNFCLSKSRDFSDSLAIQQVIRNIEITKKRIASIQE